MGIKSAGPFKEVGLGHPMKLKYIILNPRQDITLDLFEAENMKLQLLFGN